MNFLQNTNWQLAILLAKRSAVASATNREGAGPQATVAISGFTAGSYNPTFYTSNTQQLRNGSIVTFPPGLGMLSVTGLRVTDLIPNVSFTCQLPFLAKSPASVATTAYPVGITGAVGDTVVVDGGWSKTETLIPFIDDFPENSCPGAVRVLGMRKTVNGAEDLFWTCTPEQLANYRGRNIVFGGLAWQKVQGCAGTGQFFIDDGVSSTLSAALTGSGYSDPVYGGYEFKPVTQRVSKNAPYLKIGLRTQGNAGDVYYLAIPTAKLGMTLTVDDCGQPPNDYLTVDRHWNPFLFDPLIGAFPAAEIIAGSGLYGYPYLDLGAISYGQIHNTVRAVCAKLELVTPTPELIMFIGSFNGGIVPTVPLSFGLQTQTNIANLMSCTSMAEIPLRSGAPSDGSPWGCFGIFSNMKGGTITAATLDFCNVRLR